MQSRISRMIDVDIANNAGCSLVSLPVAEVVSALPHISIRIFVHILLSTKPALPCREISTVCIQTGTEEL